jgi:hypothetical protein
VTSASGTDALGQAVEVTVTHNFQTITSYLGSMSNIKLVGRRTAVAPTVPD